MINDGGKIHAPCASWAAIWHGSGINAMIGLCSIVYSDSKFGQFRMDFFRMEDHTSHKQYLPEPEAPPENTDFIVWAVALCTKWNRAQNQLPPQQPLRGSKQSGDYKQPERFQRINLPRTADGYLSSAIFSVNARAQHYAFAAPISWMPFQPLWIMFEWWCLRSIPPVDLMPIR
jgi:hypothetical protein